MEKLKICRKKCGLTLEEAAIKLGISRNSLSLYEAGKLPIPLSVTVKMLRVYNSNTIELLGVNAPDEELTDAQRIYIACIDNAVRTVRNMENTRVRMGGMKYSEERRRELQDVIINELFNNIPEPELREEVIRLHKN